MQSRSTSSGLFSNAEEWVLRAPSFIVYDMPLLESRRNTIEISGRLTPKRLAIDRMTFTDSYSTLGGSADAFLALPHDPFDPDFMREASARFTASLKAAAGPETYSIRGTLDQGKIAASLGFTSVPLGRLRTLSVKGSFSGTGTLEGPLARPAVSLSVSLNEGRLGNDPLAVNAQVSLVPDQIRISSLKLDFLAHHLSDGSGTVDLKKGEYSLKVGYAGEYFSDHVRLTARLDGRFSPEPSSPAAGLLDQGLQGKLSLGDILVEEKSFPPWAVAFRGDRGRLTFDGGPGNSIHGSIDSNLAFALHMASPLPIIGDAGGRIIGDRIVASVGIERADMLVLNSILKSPQIPRLDGHGPRHPVHLRDGSGPPVHQRTLQRPRLQRGACRDGGRNPFGLCR